MTVAIALPWKFGIAGGVNEVVRNLIIHLLQNARSRRVILVTPSDADRVEVSPGVFVDHVRLPIVDLPFGRGIRPWVSFVTKSCWRIRKWMEFFNREGVTEFHIHPGSLAALSMAIPASALLGRGPRVSVSFHGFDVREARDGSRLYRAIFRALLKRADAVNACSKWLADQLAATDLVSTSRIRICHNGIDPGTLAAELSDAGSDNLLRGPYVLCVATYEYKKGIDLLIDAFEIFGPQHPDVQLIVAGRSGDSSSLLSLQVSRSPLAHRIHLIGETTHHEAMHLMHQARLLALPSRQEPFGIVLLEAAFVSCPTVATRVGGIPEVVLDGETGLLAAPENAESLCSKIDSLLRDAAYARQLSMRARARALSSFTWQHRAVRYLTFDI